jgi:hypothetical protein
MRRRAHAPVFLALLLAAASPAFAQTAAGARHTAPAQDAAPLMPRYLLMDVQGRAVTSRGFSRPLPARQLRLRFLPRCLPDHAAGVQAGA